MMNERDSFRIVGLCWCPGTMTLDQAKFNGHTAECTRARRGWEANSRHMRELERRQAEDLAMGRALREQAQAVIARGEENEDH